MAAAPTHEDAHLLIKLYELRREERMRKARDWFAKSFHVRAYEDFVKVCPPGSDENASFRMVVSYWEMVASFLNSGVLSPELFYRNGMELIFVFERIRDILPELRSARKNPFYFLELEKAAEEMIDWLRGQAPEGYETFAKAVRGA